MNTSGMSEEIFLTRPFMPPIHDLLPYLDRIWESRLLSNNGPITEEFEHALCRHLGVKHICLFANGTLALMIALKALNLHGQVITTPFTSPATIQAIYWNHMSPVFVDINETDLNMDASAIEAAMTPLTTAILPVHMFGTPCQVTMMNQLAEKYNIKVIYDAAHCFGVEINGGSICNYGDLSVLSFHATKVFNSIEGGAIICHDENTKEYIDALKNTGLDGRHNLIGYGLNAKMNEIQSAFGICHLKYVDKVIAGRKAATMKYRNLLENIRGVSLLHEAGFVKPNYSYFPIIINPDEFGSDRDELYDYLNNKHIITRKYFYPLVSDYPEFTMYKTNDLPVAQKIAKNILCIPLYHDITDEQITFIVNSIYQLHIKQT